MADKTGSGLLENITAGPNDITRIYAAKNLAPLFYETEILDYLTRTKVPESYIKTEKLVDSIVNSRLGKHLAKVVADGDKSGDSAKFFKVLKKIEEKLGPSNAELLEHVYHRVVLRYLDREGFKEEEEWRRREMVEEDKKTQNWLNDLKEAGVATSREFSAFIFAKTMGRCLYELVPHRREQPDEKIIVPRDTFENGYIHEAITSSITSMTSLGGYFHNNGLQLNANEIVAPDFEDKAQQWLLKEAHARESGEEFAFLDDVLMSVDAQNVSWRINWDFSFASPREDFKWNAYCRKKTLKG